MYQFLVALFSFSKKQHFMQKTLVFGQMSEILSTGIKSCCCKLRGKVTSVSVNINFDGKMSILCKRIEILGKNCLFH